MVIAPDQAWAASVAKRWLERLAAKPDMVMCLPTGGTPRPIYTEMAVAVERGDASFADATIFLLDEFGGLPPGDPGRCDVMLQRDLLDCIDIPPSRVHVLDPDSPALEETASAYRELVLATGLDLTLLGIGMNGHIGLNEPGSDLTSIARRVALREETKRSQADYGGSRRPEWGVTLGIAELMTSQEIWLLATGPHKAKIVRDALEGPIGAAVPASLLREHANTTLFVDDSAAAMLDR